jgi:eukaryotic-like serine/threonine-protein kinase
MTDAAFDPLFLSFQEAVAGRYSLERELGRGGMGVVYLAREVRLDRLVAIKLLPPELAAVPALRARFLREARTAARLSHPYIVPIHTVDEIGGFVFFVMAYVDGETLAQRVAARGPLSAGEGARILREVAWALAYAHAQGVVHRDVKPANILLERGTERAMIADFGIARLAHASGDTAAGELLGTPEYMSPEHASGETVDGRSDLYSLGAVGYYALTGQLPFTAATAQGVLMQHLTKPAAPVASIARGVPRSLAQAIDRCLQKEPAARFENGEELAAALAPSLDKRTEVPVPVRIFLDRRRLAAVLAPVAAGVPISIAILGELAKHGSSALSLVGAATATGLAVLTLGSPVVVLLSRLRRLAKLGYGPGDIATALRATFERRREEFQFEYGLQLSLREKAVRAIAGAGFLVSAVSIVGILRHGPADSLGPLAFFSAYIGTLATGLSVGWRRLRRGTGSKWAAFWGGAKGRALAQLAASGLGERATIGDRPTELAIAMSAEALHARLPRDIRASVGDVPAVLRALEAQARKARARIEELDAAVGEALRGKSGVASAQQEALVAGLRAARGDAEERLSELVAALETLRLDLLRLSAGAGSVDGITADLAAAREFGEAADRLLASAREVEQALKPGQFPTG